MYAKIRAKMIIPTFIFKGRRYRITFLFFFFFANCSLRSECFFHIFPIIYGLTGKFKFLGKFRQKNGINNFLFMPFVFLRRSGYFIRPPEPYPLRKQEALLRP